MSKEFDFILRAVGTTEEGQSGSRKAVMRVLQHLRAWAQILALHLQGVWPWASHVTSLNLSFFICPMGIIIVPISRTVVRIKWDNVQSNDPITCPDVFNVRCSMNQILLALALTSPHFLTPCLPSLQPSLVFLLFLKRSKLILVSGPLYLLFLQCGALFPWLSHSCSLFNSGLCPQRGLLAVPT